MSCWPSRGAAKGRLSERLAAATRGPSCVPRFTCLEKMTPTLARWKTRAEFLCKHIVVAKGPRNRRAPPNALLLGGGEAGLEIRLDVFNVFVAD